MRKVLAFVLIFAAFRLFGDFRFGKELFDDGLYDEAKREFERTVSENPTSEEAQKALLFLGKCHQKQNNFKEAEATYRKLIRGYPKNRFSDEAFYELAFSEMRQKKYTAAISDFQKLLQDYPLSKFSKKAIPPLLQSYYENDDFQMVVVKGRKLRKQYADGKQVPEILFWMAKAYFAEKMPTEARKLISELDEKYPSSEARWKAALLEIDLVEKEKGDAAAAALLKKKLAENVPRQFEEQFRLKSVRYYLKTNDYSAAETELNKLLKKFSNSAALDEYIILKFNTLQQLGKYDEIVAEATDYRKVFRESPLKNDFELALAKAYFRKGNYEKSQAIIAEVSKQKIERKTAFDCKLLQANIYEKTGKLKAAISEYKRLTKEFSVFGKNAELLLKIGNIYFDKFQNYATAMKFYEQIITSTSKPEYQSKAALRLALCYERTGKFEQAISELAQINPEDLSDSLLVNRIEQKLNYLKKFERRDYEKGFKNLLVSVYKYLNDGDKADLQKNIISILAENLKELEESAALIDEKKGGEFVYEKAKIYLKIAEKYQVGNKPVSEKEYLQKAENLIAAIPAEKRSWKDELEIRKIILTEGIQPKSVVISKLEEFVKNYPQKAAGNEFSLLLAKYFEKQNQPEKAAFYLSALKPNESIEKEEYLRAKLKLAEYFYRQNDDKKALENYKIAQSEINLNQPEIYFHFAVALNENGFKNEAIERLSFLLENEENFADFETAVKYSAKLSRDENNFAAAVKYEKLIPEKNRDDEFYLVLAADYEALGDKENAKISLMHIQNKNEKTLEKLAEMQFETGDFEMAKYSYNELIKRNKSNLKFYEKLAHIYFAEEDFLKAAENYKKIIDKLGDNFNSFPDIKKVALENIIALYRINNRPKAETLTKKFKTVLDEKAMDEIALNKGIYYLDIDNKKAEKIFSNLVKKSNLDTFLKMKTYFWRGVARLKRKKKAEAKSDFQVAANSEFTDLSNQAHLKLGTLNFSDENYQEALADYYQVIANDKSGKLALDAAKNFAFVCKTIGEWQKAISAYRIILDKWGDSGLEAQTIFDIAFCYFRDKKYEKAIEMFEKALPMLADKEQQAETQYWIGESYFGLENYEAAVRELLKVSYNYPDFTQWSASAELRAGEAYFNLGEFDKARRIYKKLISKYGKFSNWGKEAAKRLEKM